MRVVVATRNEGKIKEINQIMSDIGIKAVSQQELGINTVVVEDGSTFEENALKKAREVMKICREITLADDSGLEVDYLNGAPGIYSARYAGEKATDWERNQKLLSALEGVPFEKRTARFVCAIAVVFPDGQETVVRGECKGFIAFEPAGSGGFGYDPLFSIPEYNKTMAELDMSIKNKISHRARALSLLREVLKKYMLA